jgi:outer membrane protein assembly factor BamB
MPNWITSVFTMKIPAILSLCLLLPLQSSAQVGRLGWTMFGGDTQRTGWNRVEEDLTQDNVKGLKLEWSLKLDNAPKGLNGLTVPIVLAGLPTPRGVKDLVIVAGSSDKLFVIDADTGKLFWEKTLAIKGTAERSDTWLCPNSLNATPVIGNVPGKGQGVFLLASDGVVHAFNLISGEDLFPPTPFVPPFAKVWSMTFADNTLYTTSAACNGLKSSVFAMSLSDPGREVTVFTTAPWGGGISTGGVWGRAGAAMTSDGKLVIETGDGPWNPAKGDYSDSFLILTPKDLKLADYYTPPNHPWLTKKDLDMGSISPTVFKFRNWELAAAGGKEGVIVLLDTKSPGGADHRTPLYRSSLVTNQEINFAGKGFWGAFSTWQDEGGTRWLYAPAYGPPAPGASFPIQYGETPNGSLMAFKVEEKDGKPVLTPAWNSVDMMVPTPAVIANGMVFVLTDGDSPVQFGNSGGILNIDQRKARAGHETLYALDAATGKVLFSSGDTIKSFSHFSAPVVFGGRVYAVTYDGTLYAFSLGSPLSQ